MFSTIGCRYPSNTEDLLGVLEYYDAVFRRNGLVHRDGEFRSLKLGLVLDLLKTISIPDELRMKLISAVIRSWRMSPLAKTFASSDEELKKILQGIECVRSEIRNAAINLDSQNSMLVDIPVIFVLPLMPSDLETADVPMVHDLLRQAMNSFAARTDAGVASN